MNDVVALCPRCADALRIEWELTIQPHGPCFECGAALVVVDRPPGLPWVLGLALWSRDIESAREKREKRIAALSRVPPPPAATPLLVGEKEPGWDE